MSEFSVTENFMLAESFRLIDEISQKQFSVAVDELKKTASNSLAISSFGLDEQINKVKEITQKVQDSLLQGESYPIDSTKSDLEYLKKAIFELMSLLSFMEINNKISHKIIMDYEHTAETYAEISESDAMEIIDDMAEDVGREAVGNLLALTTLNSPIRLHKNKVLTYMEERLNESLINLPHDFTKSDFEVIKKNINVILFPETVFDNVTIFKEFLDQVIVDSFLDETINDFSDINDAVAMEVSERTIVNTTIASHILHCFQSCEKLLAAFRTSLLLEEAGYEMSNDGLKKYFKKPIVWTVGCQITELDEIATDELIELMEENNLEYNIFPNFVSDTEFFEQCSNISSVKVDIMSEMFVISSLYKNREGELDESTRKKYNYIAELLNMLNPDIILNSYSVIGEQLTRAEKKNLIDAYINEIEERLNSDSRMFRYARTNHVNCLRMIALFDEDDLVSEFINYFSDAKPKEKFSILANLVDVFQTYKMRHIES